MSELDEKFQQQILFEDSSLDAKKKDFPQISEQVIVDNQNWQVQTGDDYHQQDQQVISSKPRWMWRIIGLLFTVVLGFETFSFFQQGFAQTPILAGFYAGLLACLTLVVGNVSLKELSALRQFKQQQARRNQAQQILDEENPLDGHALCQAISANLPCDLMLEHEQNWQALNKDDYSDAEIVQLYSREILAKVDDKALAEVAKFSTESVVLVALSPIALVDMLLMFWRNLRMIDKIARLYGIKIGYWSRLRLIKQVFVNMAYAGASELVMDLGADLLGADLLSKLSARLAQGLGAGMLTARLGIKTIQLCRPIPFDQNAPKVADLRKSIITKVKDLLFKK